MNPRQGWDASKSPHGGGLAELRTAFGVSQTELAEQLGVTQAAVLKAERAADPQLSSLRRFVAAIGARLGLPARVDVIAVIDGAEFPLSLSKEEEMRPNQLLERRRTHAASSRSDSTAPAGKTAWRLRAWDDAFLEQRFLDEAMVAMSDDEIGDLTEWPGDAAVKDRLAALERFAVKGLGTRVRYLRDFRVEMQPADIVVVPLSGGRAAIGELSGEYEYEAREADSKMRHRRRVKWLRIVRRSDLDDDLLRVVNAPGTICRFRSIDAASRLRRYESEGGTES